MTQPTQPKLRMLVVEDDTIIANALRRYFTASGYHVDCASEVEEAEALVVTSRYDIVIADLRLSRSFDGEGLQVLQFVRRHSRGTPVVILSASDSANIERYARSLGAEAFLPKPAMLPAIAATVELALETRA